MTFLEWTKLKAKQAWAEGRECPPDVLHALQWAGVDVAQLERETREELAGER